MFTPGSRACGYRTASGRGKWPSRDPIGEEAFVEVAAGSTDKHRRNARRQAQADGLYRFANNSFKIDRLGLEVVALYDGADGGADPVPWWCLLCKNAKGEHFKLVASQYKHAIDVKGVQDAVSKLDALVASGVTIEELYIIDHGQSGYQELGNQAISTSAGNNRPTPDDGFVQIASRVSPKGVIHLTGCSVAKGELGQQYLQDLANLANRTVTGYDQDNDIYKRPPYFRPKGNLITKYPRAQ